MKDNVVRGRFPWVTVALIVVNLAVFGLQLLQPADRSNSLQLARSGISERQQALLEYGAIPYRITHPGSDCGVAYAHGTQQVICNGAPRADVFPQLGYPSDLNTAPWWTTLLTSMFMHAGIIHIVLNLGLLWIFGNAVEDRLGHARFLGFYLLAGLLTTYAQALIDMDSTTPMVGSSGAVAAVLGLYLMLHPRSKVLWFVLIPLFFTFVEIPSVLLIGAWLGIQFIPGIGQLFGTELSAGAGVPYIAHVAGLLFGLAVGWWMLRRGDHSAELGEAVPG